jgi:hypothetical protein
MRATLIALLILSGITIASGFAAPLVAIQVAQSIASFGAHP